MTILPREKKAILPREGNDYIFKTKVKRTMASIFTEKRYMQKYHKAKRDIQHNDSKDDDSTQDTDDILDSLEVSDGDADAMDNGGIILLKNKIKWKKARLLKCLKHLVGGSLPDDIEALELSSVKKEVLSEEKLESTITLDNNSKERRNKWKNVKQNVKVRIDYNMDISFYNIYIKYP